MIHAVVNNHEVEHLSTLLKTSSTIIDQKFCILIDRGAIEIFISSVVLKKIKVKEVDKNMFRYIEMALGAKQRVGGKVTDCSINLGDFVTKAKLYVTIL